jgi:hypothetical protein
MLSETNCWVLFRGLSQGIASVTGAKSPGSYQPDYTRCADHFLLHAGGYAILRGIQKGLRLPAEAMMPSFASLRDFGNTSSASTWYTWSYIEATMGVKKNETILQVQNITRTSSSHAFMCALRCDVLVQKNGVTLQAHVF